MSWAAHDLEPYLFRAKFGARISLVWCLIGSYSPDVLTKWAVYGFGFSHHDAILSDPVQFHRGWPGAGFTHTPFWGFAVTGVILLLTRNRTWAFSYLIGAIAHVLSDSLDSVGVMMLFPLSTRPASTVTTSREPCSPPMRSFPLPTARKPHSTPA